MGKRAKKRQDEAYTEAQTLSIDLIVTKLRLMESGSITCEDLEDLHKLIQSKNRDFDKRYKGFYSDTVLLTELWEKANPYKDLYTYVENVPSDSPEGGTIYEVKDVYGDCPYKANFVKVNRELMFERKATINWCQKEFGMNPYDY